LNTALGRQIQADLVFKSAETDDRIEGVIKNWLKRRPEGKNM
jgi:hypothetical protein